MKKVTCKDCGRVYDFDKDDFCPKCGSFNPPVDEGATILERDLLSRFEGNRTQQAADGARQRERQKARSTEAMPQRSYSYACAPSVKVAAPQAKGQYWHGGEPCEEAEAKGGARRGLIVLLAAGVVLLAALVVFVVLPTLGADGESAYETHALSGDFSMGALEISIDDVRWLTLTEGSRLYREGYDLLLVDVYITGGAEFDRQFPFGSVYLAMPGDWYIPLERDELTAGRLRDLSVYMVELRDVVWEDPLMGSFAFYVPRGVDTATLCLEETEKKLFSGEGTLKAVHQVPLELSGREGAGK